MIEDFLQRLRATSRPDEYFRLTFGERFRTDGFGYVTGKVPDIYVTKWTFQPTLDDCQCVAAGRTIEEVIEGFERWIAARESASADKD